MFVKLQEIACRDSFVHSLLCPFPYRVSRPALISVPFTLQQERWSYSSPRYIRDALFPLNGSVHESGFLPWGLNWCLGKLLFPPFPWSSPFTLSRRPCPLSQLRISFAVLYWLDPTPPHCGLFVVEKSCTSTPVTLVVLLSGLQLGPACSFVGYVWCSFSLLLLTCHESLQHLPWIAWMIVIRHQIRKQVWNQASIKTKNIHILRLLSETRFRSLLRPTPSPMINSHDPVS